MRIRAGDNVVVISGKDKGKTGTVLRVLAGTHRVVVSDINMRTKHMKKTPQRAGQKITYEASIHISNVMPIDPKTKKRTRLGVTVDDKGKKQRVAKRSGEVLKAVKPSTKKTGSASSTTTPQSDAKKKDTKKKEVKEKKETQETKVAKQESAEKGAAPGKKPFWKKMMGFGSDAAADADVDEGSHMQQDHSIPDSSATTSRRSSGRGS